jgi:two-component system cell cycle sensor histidine kinase/response regulator CckA
VDAVVADVRMPAMGGAELGRALARSRPNLPVVYISGWLEEQLPETAAIPRGAPFLSKPFGPEALLQVVQRALRERSDTN